MTKSSPFSRSLNEQAYLPDHDPPQRLLCLIDFSSLRAILRGREMDAVQLFV